VETPPIFRTAGRSHVIRTCTLVGCRYNLSVTLQAALETSAQVFPFESYGNGTDEESFLIRTAIPITAQAGTSQASRL